jgi:hypothetical protein
MKESINKTNNLEAHPNPLLEQLLKPTNTYSLHGADSFLRS